jgi:hypothetical protein
MLAVLHLDPVLGSPGALGSIAPLRHHAFQTHVAGRAEQVWPDLASLERRYEDAVRPTREQPRQIGLADRERQAAQVLTIEGEASRRSSG